MNEDKTIPEDNNTLILAESTENETVDIITADDEVIIDDTIESIREIYENGVLDTMTKIGELILEKIYKNNLDSFLLGKKAENSEAKKYSHIFEQLLNKSEELAEKGDHLPRKTWLYNSVRLFRDLKRLSDFSEYDKLSISHRIALLTIDDKEQKEIAINEIIEKQLPVREARKYINSLIEKRPKGKSLLNYIRNPLEIENEGDFLATKVKALDTEDKKNSVLTACQERIAAIDEQISKDRASKKKLKELVDRVNKVEVINKDDQEKEEVVGQSE